jgi:2-oxoisovalerate dehydrogenase E1 component alpha subunit
VEDRNASSTKRPRPGPRGLASADQFLSADRCLELHRVMVRARKMEERLIKMSKSGEGIFWIGGPGEEAINACLGLQSKCGEGPAFDYFHLHYRCSALMVALGMDPIDSIRQMANVATDPFSRGRNFPSHFSRRAWNVLPVSSVIGIQWVKAPGTAIVQKRHGGDGVTIVVGGDAGTAEGDFQSCLIWSTRPQNELPVLMVVLNNGGGISTTHCSQHSCANIIERAKPFGIEGEIVDGNDPVASWHAVERAMKVCREERRPYILEARTSRLYGHSSSSGAPRSQEADCIELFERRLISAGLIHESTIQTIHDQTRDEIDQAVAQAVREAKPLAGDETLFTYAPNPADSTYPEDYTTLP